MTTLYWKGVLAVEGLPTGDGRHLALAAMRWPTLPLPLFRLGPPDAEQPAALVGSIVAVWRAPAAPVDDQPGAEPVAVIAAVGRYTGDEWKAGDQAAIAMDCRIDSDAIRLERNRIIINRAELAAAHIGGQPAWEQAVVTFSTERPD